MEPESPTKSVSRAQPLERKKVSKPSGQLKSTNLGIKSILNPEIKKDENSPEIGTNGEQPTEQFTFEELMHAWKTYALQLKREKKDSLYSTLMSSEPRLSSDLKITLDIKNSIEAKDLDNDKPNFLGFIRKKLRNYNITFEYIIAETTKVEFSDSKTKFDKLTKENESLTKLRKLFNLDIDF